MYVLAGQVLGALVVFFLVFWGLRAGLPVRARLGLALILVVVWLCLGPSLGFPLLRLSFVH